MMEMPGPSLGQARGLVGGRVVSTVPRERGGRPGAVPSLPSASLPEDPRSVPGQASLRGSAMEQGGGEGALLDSPAPCLPMPGPALPSQEAPQISVAMMSS